MLLNTATRLQYNTRISIYTATELTISNNRMMKQTVVIRKYLLAIELSWIIHTNNDIGNEQNISETVMMNTASVVFNL